MLKPDTHNYTSIRPGILTVYLKQHGWIETKVDPTFSLWRRPEPGSMYEVHQLKDQSIARYDRRVRQAIDELASFEGSDVDKVIDRLINMEYDLFSARIIGDDVKQGRIPLRDGVKLFSSFKDLITAAARSSERKAAVYKGGKLSTKIKDFIDGLLLDQTAMGSYVVNISHHLPINDLNNEAGFVSSANRGLSESLSKAISAAYDIATQTSDTIDSTFLTASVNKGVSANLLDAIVNMSGSKSSRSVELSIQLSGFELTGQEYAKSITFDPRHISNLKKASKFYRKNYEVPEFELEGFVHGQTLDHFEGIGGDVEIYTILDGATRIVLIHLDRDQYELALTVHGKPVTVKCSGKLVVTPNTHRLENVSGFRVTGQDLNLDN